MSIQQSLNRVKKLVEEAIISGGEKKKHSLIRSSTLINCVHEAVKNQIIEYGIQEDRIHPPIGQSKGEMNLFGFLKAKKQDVCIIPNFGKISPIAEKQTSGLLYGMTDIYGEKYTEQIISINVRSQLSSMAKNFDTLYERTFAESINLHTRCPKIVLGEVYMIPTSEYDSDSDSAQRNQIKFIKKVKSVEKYIRAFQAINNRQNEHDDFFKYERVCLLVVDFSQPEPNIFNSDEDLINAGYLTENSNVSIEGLSFTNFIHDLMDIHRKRF